MIVVCVYQREKRRVFAFCRTNLSSEIMPTVLLLLIVLSQMYGPVYCILPVSTLPPPGTCQTITAVNMCINIGWNASFPNFREHQTQSDANEEISSFYPLVRTRCSNAIAHFLCSVYAPVCISSLPDGTEVTLKPCRNLCTYVRTPCEPIMNQNGFEWPAHLDCNNFPVNGSSSSKEDLCLDIPNLSTVDIPHIPDLPLPTVTQSSATTAASVQPSATSSVTHIPTATPQSTSLTCVNSLDNHALGNSSYSYTFASLANCGVKCGGIYFTEVERNVVAPAFILVCAIICICFTLFTVGTFLIDRQRYHYPERPVIFLGLCYLILSLAFVVGAIVKLKDSGSSYACSDTTDTNSFVFQHLPNSTPTYRSASCVILFIFIYYFQMAGAIWWVILTLTWFMASTLKWGEEAVERPWVLYHIFAWCIPAIQVILILALRLVDGDQLSGICFAGNSNPVGLGVFVVMPLIIFLVSGIIFLVIGFGSLVQIHLQISKDPNKSKRLQRLIIRILIYASLYIVPNVIYLCLCLYELAERPAWEVSYTKYCHNSQEDSCTSPSFTGPQFAALLMKYLMLFIIGIFSTFWVISWKTLLAWKKFFNSIFCCQNSGHDYESPQKKSENAV